jgi:DnaD/phage-associated family protein
MAYVEAHAGLRDHLKTKKVARTLNIPKTQVIGHLLCLWWWCQEYAQDGDLSQFSSMDLAEAAEWPGMPEAFVNALLSCGVKGGAGFLGHDEDGRLVVNDWLQYGGKLFVRRDQTAKRVRKLRDGNAPVTRYDSVTGALHVDEKRVTDQRVTHIDLREDKTRQEKTKSTSTEAMATVFRCYEENISLLTQIISDDLGDLADTYGPENVIRAIQESARNNARSIKYVAKVLDNWQKGNVKPQTNGQRNGSPFTSEGVELIERMFGVAA